MCEKDGQEYRSFNSAEIKIIQKKTSIWHSEKTFGGGGECEISESV